MTKKSTKNPAVSVSQRQSLPWQNILAKWLRRSLAVGLVGASLALTTSSAQAATRFWNNQTQSNQWNTTDVNWGDQSDGTGSYTYTIYDHAQFTDVGLTYGGLINITNAIVTDPATNATVQFRHTTGEYTLTGESLTLTGQGQFTKSGAGILTINNTVIAGGGINFQSGRINLGANSSITGDIDVGILGGTLGLADGYTLAAALKMSSGNLDLEVASGEATVTSELKNNKILKKTGAGTVIYDRNQNGFSGSLDVSEGTWVIKNTGGSTRDFYAYGSGGITVGSGATLEVARGVKITSPASFKLDGGTLKLDASGLGASDSLVTFSNTNNYDLLGGFIDVVNTSGLTSGTSYTIIDGGSFNFAGQYVGKVNGVLVGSGGPINDRYEGSYFDDTSSVGKLKLVIGEAADDARIATWDGSVNNTWSEMNADANWVLQGNATQKMFKNGDWVEFGNSSSTDNTITVSATGTSTSVVVQSMTVSGANNWTFTGSGITGTAVAPATDADFNMNGTGIVKFENVTKFTNYKVNSGTLQTAAGKKLDGAVQLAASGKLSAGYGTEITGQLDLVSESTIVVDMTGATTAGSGLKAASVVLASGTFNVNVINFSGTDSSYTVIEDVSGNFDFSGQYNGTINGQSPPVAGTPNERYGTMDFDSTTTQGKLFLTTSGSDSARMAYWDYGSGTWNETGQDWSLINSSSKYFKNGDDVEFNGVDDLDNSIVVDAYGSATSVGVGTMAIEGTNDWTFSGDAIVGSGDFTKNGTGTVEFQNDTTFANYKINTGTLKTVEGADLTGNVSVAAPATLDAEYGSIIDGILTVTVGSTLKIDMTGASGSQAGLDVSSMSKTGTGAFNVDVTGIGSTNGSYTVIDATNFDFTDTFVGSIDGKSPPIVTPPNERYGKTDFNTATAGKLIVDVNGADIARTAAFKGTDGAWNETSQNWNLDGGSTSNYFKTGDQVVFNGATGQTVAVAPTSPATSMNVSGMTVSGGSEWTFTGNKILGQALTDPGFGDGKLNITGTGTKAIFQNEIDFKGGIVIANGNSIVFDYDDTTPILNDNSISGAGSVVKDGTADLMLTGVNTYTGGTTVYDGTLTAGDKNALGTGTVTTIGNGILNLDFEGEFKNKIEGTGKVEASGDGVIINDTTSVEMVVSGVLSGTSTYKSLIVKGSGTLSPGNSPGEIKVSNGATFEDGSIYEYEIASLTSYDKLTVSAGDVVIEEGAQLKVEFLGDFEAEKDNRFQVIEAAQGQFTGDLFTLIGRWDTSFSQSIEADGYWITFVQRDPEFANAVRGYATPNAYRTAVAMDSIYTVGLESNIQTLYDALAGMPDNDPVGLAAAFQQLHGEAYASGKEASAQLQRRFVRNLPSALDRIAKSGCSPCDSIGCSSNRNLNLWGSFTGDWINRHNIGSFSGYKLNTAGVMVGADRSVGKRGFAGIAFGYDNATQDFKTISSKNEMDIFRVMGYGGLRRGSWYADGYIGYTNDRHDVKRDIGFADFSGKARSKFNDDMFSTGFEIGRKMKLGKTLLTPSFGVHYIYLDSPSATESGAGDANLYISGGKFDSLRLPIGVKISRDFQGRKILWTPEARAFYVAELGDASASARTAFNKVRNVGFTASSGKWGRSSGVFGLGLKGQLSDRLHVRADYDHEVYEHTDMGEASVSVGMNW